MLAPIATALLGMLILLSAWLLVQRMWRGMFPGSDGEEDALAGRGGCSDCRCTGRCVRGSEGSAAGRRPIPSNDPSIWTAGS